MITIQEAKEYLKSTYGQKGIKCPVCNQNVTLWKRPLSSGSARSLIILYKIDRENPGKWVHIQQEFAQRKLNANSMNYILLPWYGLIESKKGNDDPKKKASGFWRITQSGRDFVEGRVTMPSHVYIINNTKDGQSDKYIDIRTALGKEFDYRELMAEFYREPNESPQQSLF